MTINFFKNQKGFTLVETIVAIGIIMAAIAGPMSAAQKGLAAASLAKDQFVAQYLAQDAIEYYEYLRDKNIQTGNTGVNWLVNMRSPSGGIGQNCRNNGTNQPGCTLDTTDTLSSPFSDVNGPPNTDPQTLLYKNSKGQFTNASSGSLPPYTPTQYRRLFQVEYANSLQPDEVVVSSTVYWNNGKNTNSVTVRKNLFNR